VINPTADPVEVTLGFSDTVSLSSLPQAGFSEELAQPIAGKNFELSVPALGILSMQLADATEAQLIEIPQDRPVKMRNAYSDRAGSEATPWI
jgi:hypothetical protein